MQNDLEKHEQIRRFLDWRDYWLAEGAFMLSREVRILEMELNDVSGGLIDTVQRMVLRPGGKTELKPEDVVDSWMEVVQQIFLNAAWEELLAILPKNILADKSSPPDLRSSAVGKHIAEAAVKNREDLEKLIWSNKGSSEVLALFGSACDMVMKRAYASTI